MGHGWDHSYNVRITDWSDTSGHFDLWDGTGRSDRFFRGTNGVYTREEFFLEGTVTNGAFTLTFPDTGRWIFNPFDGSPTEGKIARIVDRNGNALDFQYDLMGRLTKATDTLDRSFSLTYTPEGFLHRLTDFSGRTVTYSYHSVASTNARTANTRSTAAWSSSLKRRSRTSRWRTSSRPKCWAVRSMSCRRRRAACSATSAN